MWEITLICLCHQGESGRGEGEDGEAGVEDELQPRLEDRPRAQRRCAEQGGHRGGALRGLPGQGQLQESGGTKNSERGTFMCGIWKSPMMTPTVSNANYKRW